MGPRENVFQDFTYSPVDESWRSEFLFAMSNSSGGIETTILNSAGYLFFLKSAYELQLLLKIFNESSVASREHLVGVWIQGM